MALQPTSATMPSAHATMLSTNRGSSCRWLRMIPTLGTNAATDTLPGVGLRQGGKVHANLEIDRVAYLRSAA